MEGLIKGLVDVALGGRRGGDNGDNGDDEGNSRSRDERSRSSWAQVVSGEEDDQNRAGQSFPQDRRPNRGAQENQWTDGERTSSRHSHKAQEENTEGRNKYVEENQKVENDGWETVGEKKPKRQSHKVQKEQWQQYKRPPSEQEYSEDGQTPEPSALELSGLSEACNKLWELDFNRLGPGKDYEIDCGDGKKVHEREDVAEGYLFSWVSDEIFKKPSFARFCSLLDNYNPNEGYKEVVTAEERQEQAAFIEEISRTAPIKYLHMYLLQKGIASDDYQEFKKMLKSLWFDLYGRGGTSGSSSAFEHVFVGEIKQSGGEQVCGFHNWLQFYLEEAKGHVDYQGYIFPRRRGGEIPDSETQLLTIQFEWNGVLKSVSSTLVGVSPEFEVALYTLCFFMGGEDNSVQLGPYSVNVKCYRLGNNRIGSAFPIAES